MIMTKAEMIAVLKEEYPILKVGDDDAGYTQLNQEEYEKTISEWAEARLSKLAKKAAQEAETKSKAEAKAAAEAKLVALGLDLKDLRALGL